MRHRKVRGLKRKLSRLQRNLQENYYDTLLKMYPIENIVLTLPSFTNWIFRRRSNYEIG